MTKKIIAVFMIIYYLFSSLFSNEEGSLDRIINNTERKFRSVDDYEVKMTISMSIPAFRMPKKKSYFF